MAEWLRRWTANPMGSARVGSNPILVEYFFKKPAISQMQMEVDMKGTKHALLSFRRENGAG